MSPRLAHRFRVEIVDRLDVTDDWCSWIEDGLRCEQFSPKVLQIWHDGVLAQHEVPLCERHAGQVNPDNLRCSWSFDGGVRFWSA